MKLAAPAASFEGLDTYADLPSKAAVLTYALSKRQACIDGNKRIALILLNEFLAINGTHLEMTNDVAATMILQAAESSREHRDRTILDLTQMLEGAIVNIDEED